VPGPFVQTAQNRNGITAEQSTNGSGNLMSFKGVTETVLNARTFNQKWPFGTILLDWRFLLFIGETCCVVAQGHSFERDLSRSPQLGLESTSLRLTEVNSV
jgi:hypothetical protein